MPSISFSGHELLNTAIGIERRGIIFYDIMAKSTDNDTARDVFQYLAENERDHIQTFQAMLHEADDYQPIVAPSEGYAAYLQALVDSAAFTDDMVTSEMATQVDSDVEAIELAIGAEKDSMLFYYQLKEIMPPRAHPTVNKIIAEEKLHLAQLIELKKQLASL